MLLVLLLGVRLFPGKSETLTLGHGHTHGPVAVLFNRKALPFKATDPVRGLFG